MQLGVIWLLAAKPKIKAIPHLLEEYKVNRLAIVLICLSSGSLAFAEDGNLLDQLGLAGFTEASSGEAAAVRGQGFAVSFGDSETHVVVTELDNLGPWNADGDAESHVTALGRNDSTISHSTMVGVDADFSVAGTPEMTQTVVLSFDLGSTGYANSTSR